MDFAELWKQLLDIVNGIKKEAEKHKFELVKLSLSPFCLEFACKRAATEEVIFYFEISRKEDGSFDMRVNYHPLIEAVACDKQAIVDYPQPWERLTFHRATLDWS